MTYEDFDLVLDRAADGYRATALDGSGRRATAGFTLPFSELSLENFLLRLGRTRRTVRRIESPEMKAAKGFGASLFDAVFTGPVGAAFARSLRDARQVGAGLRIRLRLADPALADLPWEYLYNPAVNRFLGLSIHTPLVRYIELPGPIAPLGVTTPVRVLVMIASPTDYPPLDAEAEWNRLHGALADLLAAGLIAIDRLDEATLPALQRRLRRSRYHMFHFIGHGEFDQAAQEGVLLLEDGHHRGHRVSSQYLGMLLHDHVSLRVAVLNACEGARTSLHDPFAGSAQTLVQQGIPAVIAMQFEIADDVAGSFAHEFYGALADGYPVDAAITEARKAIFASGRDVEWGTPVLYLRAHDGRIFDVVRPPAAPAVPRRQAAATVVPAEGGLEHAAMLRQTAEVALAHGEYADAEKLLREAMVFDPGAPWLDELMKTAGEQRAVAEVRARRRRSTAAPPERAAPGAEAVAAASAIERPADAMNERGRADAEPAGARPESDLLD